MTKPRTLFFAALSVSCVALALSGCGDDDDGTPISTGGKAGASGGAGKAGGSGEGGSGEAGATGTAAEGGAPASQAGGSGEGAQSGSGGTLTTGGTAGTAGQTPNPGGNGGQAGDAAGAGGTPAGELLTCKIGCTTNDDCAPETEGRHCDETLNRCVECITHDDCIPAASLWVTVCTGDADCVDDLFGTICVDIGGSGRCAAAPDPDPEVGCAFPGLVSVPYPRFGITPEELVDACATQSGRCSSENLCFTGCTDSEDFCTFGSPGNGDTCNPTTGLCECASDDECTQGPPHCNPVTHRCDECASVDDCAGAEGGQDVCRDGRCGCSSLTVCSDSRFPEGTPLCE